MVVFHNCLKCDLPELLTYLQTPWHPSPSLQTWQVWALLLAPRSRSADRCWPGEVQCGHGSVEQLWFGQMSLVFILFILKGPGLVELLLPHLFCTQASFSFPHLSSTGLGVICFYYSPSFKISRKLQGNLKTNVFCSKNSRGTGKKGRWNSQFKSNLDPGMIFTYFFSWIIESWCYLSLYVLSNKQLQDYNLTGVKFPFSKKRGDHQQYLLNSPHRKCCCWQSSLLENQSSFISLSFSPFSFSSLFLSSPSPSLPPILSPSLGFLNRGVHTAQEVVNTHQI